MTATHLIPFRVIVWMDSLIKTKGLLVCTLHPHCTVRPGVNGRISWTRRSLNALPLTSWAARTAEARRQADRGNGRRGAFIWTVRSASTIGRPEHKTARIRSQEVYPRRHPRPTNRRSQYGVYFPRLEHRIGRVFGCCRWPPPFGSARVRQEEASGLWFVESLD